MLDSIAEPKMIMIKSFFNVVSLYFFSALFAVSSMAAENEVLKKTSVEAFSMSNMLNMFMGLVVVIALILGLAWVLKKYGKLPGNNLVDMKVIGGLSLGAREKAILIEVDNTRLLVGVTPGHIQTLHVLGESDAEPASFDATLNKQLDQAQSLTSVESSHA